MRKTLYCVLIAFVLSLGTLSAISEASALFLLISPGARAGGMGEAQVAVANDAYASYWNPAGLAFLEGSEIALMMYLIHISEPTRPLYISYAGFCLKKKKQFCVVA